MSLLKDDIHFLLQNENKLKYPFKFSLREDFHRPDAFRSADLCIALMSCNRTNYLIKTLESLFSYIQKYEPSLSYKLIWIDTGSMDQSYLNVELSKRYHFDQKFFFSTIPKSKLHEGITTTYLYSVQFCEKTRYFLPLEEDWELVKTPKIGFIDKTIKLLDKGPHSLMGIVFKDTCRRQQPEETLNITINDNEMHTILYSHKRVYSYSNGGSIYRMSNMKELIGDGKLDRSQSYELSISQAATKQGMYFGLVDFVDNCTKPPGDCHGVFHHIGIDSTWFNK